MHAFLYGIGGLLAMAAGLGICIVIVKLALVWFGLSLLVLALAYLFNKPGIFRKRSNGMLPIWVRWLFVPFLMLVSIYNKIRRYNSSVPPMHQVADNVYVGSRMTGSELALLQQESISAILDVTAEFDALNYDAHDRHIAYLNIPILDHAVPSTAQLTKALHWIDHQHRLGRKVLVHCAMGRGRSVLMVLAYLLAKNPQAKVKQLIDQIQSKRHKARLNRRQLRFLKKCQAADHLTIRSNVYVIANTKSGGGKWLYQGQQVLDRLSEFFNVRECLLSDRATAADWVRQAKRDDVGIVVACGGDGTLTAVAEQLVGSDIVLGVIPLGTANAVAKTLFGVLDANIETACDAIIEGQSIKIDTAQCNGKPMLLMAAIGFEEKMISHSEQIDKDGLGQLAYLQGLWQAINQNTLFEVEVSLDDQAPETIETASLAVANLAPFTSVLSQGGGLPNYSDGMLDVTWLAPGKVLTDNVRNLFELAVSGLLSSATDEAIEPTEAIHHRTAKRIHINAVQCNAYVIDGEVYHDLPITVTSLPKSLNIISNRP